MAVLETRRGWQRLSWVFQDTVPRRPSWVQVCFLLLLDDLIIAVMLLQVRAPVGPGRGYCYRQKCTEGVCHLPSEWVLDAN